MIKESNFFKKEVERQFEGNVSVRNASELGNPAPNSTGSYNLDFDLAIPFPEGSIIEIYGPEGSLKTSSGFHAIARALIAGKKCAFINMERSGNKSHLEKIASLRPFLDKDKDGQLFIIDANSGEKALDSMKLFIQQFPGSMVMLDSVDACIPEALLSGSIGEMKVGNHAKLMSDAMRKLVDIAYQGKSTLIFINQQRSKIMAYGNPNSTSGGNALGYYAHQRIELMKPGKAQQIIDSEGETIGVLLRYKIMKNKYQPCGQEGEIPILYGHGIFNGLELIDMALKFGVLSFGGKGGKQVLLPQWNKDRTDFIRNKEKEIEIKALPRMNAARLLTIDTKLYAYVDEKLKNMLQTVVNTTFLQETDIEDATEDS